MMCKNKIETLRKKAGDALRKECREEPLHHKQCMWLSMRQPLTTAVHSSIDFNVLTLLEQSESRTLICTSRSGAKQSSSRCAGIIMGEIGCVADDHPSGGRDGTAAGLLAAYGHSEPCLSPKLSALRFYP